jgi:hypothetical protein
MYVKLRNEAERSGVGMKELLAGLTVPLTASFTGCFAVYGVNLAAVTAPARQATFCGGADPFWQFSNGAMPVRSHGAG